MIIVRYTGGLGNQMFEYAMNVILMENFPQEKIYADLTRYELLDEHDGFDIVKYFNVDIKEIDNSTLKKIAPIHYWVRKMKLNEIVKYRAVGKIEKINDYFERKNESIGIIRDYFSTNYNEDAFCLNYDKVQTWHYKGNWINPLYWDGQEQLVQNCFQFNENLLTNEDQKIIEEMQDFESVGIHIRKGDYTGNYSYDLCTEKYYREAVCQIKERINGEIKFYVFSETDAIDLKFLYGTNYKFVAHPKQGGIDLWMMSKCKHNIIANSTFSYWSAILNRNIKKIIVAPLYVYREKEVCRKLPVPNGWIQINNL